MDKLDLMSGKIWINSTYWVGAGPYADLIQQVINELGTYQWCAPFGEASEVPVLCTTDLKSLNSDRLSRKREDLMRARFDLGGDSLLGVPENYLSNKPERDSAANAARLHYELVQKALKPVYVKFDSLFPAGSPEIGEAFEVTWMDYWKIILADLLVHGSSPSLGWSLYQVFRRGLFPVEWKGTWPKGYCVAYAPKGSPQAQLPAEWIPTPEQLAEGNPPMAPKPAAITLVEESVVPVSSWAALVSARKPDVAMRQHFSTFAETPECRAVLERLSKYVMSISQVSGNLEFRLRQDDSATSLARSQEVTLVCAPPYTGSLKGLPRSVASVVRRHNGMKVDQIHWQPLVRGKFPIEWEAWYEADDRSDPFAKPPLVPILDISDLWLLHPIDRRTPQEPTVINLEHEGGRLGTTAPPYGVGGVLLRLWLGTVTRYQDDGGLKQFRA